MKYYVTLAGRTVEVDLEGSRAVVEGGTFEVHFVAVPGGPLRHLLLGPESWTVAAERLEGAAPERWALGAAGQRFVVDVVDERTRHIQALTGARRAPAAGGVVLAPMPGLVVRIEVGEGQRVEAGAGLVVVEAMKMENELRAPRPGVVARVHVAVGDAVEKGAPLVTLESVEPAG